MKGLGAILIVLGGIGLVYALRMDTSVKVAGMSERVHNVGLMNQRQTILIVSGVALVGGFIFTGLATVASQMGGTARKPETPQRAKPIAARVEYSYGAKVLLVVGVGLAAFLAAAWVFTHM
jgi:hypothetical protein